MQLIEKWEYANNLIQSRHAELSTPLSAPNLWASFTDPRKDEISCREDPDNIMNQDNQSPNCSLLGLISGHSEMMNGGLCSIHYPCHVSHSMSHTWPLLPIFVVITRPLSHGGHSCLVVLLISEIDTLTYSACCHVFLCLTVLVWKQTHVEGVHSGFGECEDI